MTKNQEIFLATVQNHSNGLSVKEAEEVLFEVLQTIRYKSKILFDSTPFIKPRYPNDDTLFMPSITSECQ